MNKLLTSIVAFLSCTFSHAAEVTNAPATGTLDAIFAGGAPWETTEAQFVQQNLNAGFRWLSTAHDSAQSNRKDLTLFGQPINQAVIQFAKGKISGISILFYNRGDAGEILRDPFEAMEAQCEKAISQIAKTTPTPRGQDPKNAVKASGLIWKTDISQFLLEYSMTKNGANFRPEFIRLTVTPAEKQKSLLEQTQAASLTPIKFSGPAHVKKDPGGDVSIDDIPMVDQGAKGYCVVATAERVMRYYGVRVDEHELAQIANSDASKGTSNEVMILAIEKLCNRLRVKTRTLLEFNGHRFLTLTLPEYNRAAKKGKRAPEIQTGLHNNLAQLYQQMDSSLLCEVRTKNPAEMDHFFRLTQKHIDSGIPVLWSVMIGIQPQPNDPKGFGGHTRLIIGYNAKTNEIIYTDSWGIGHEKKRMSLADAWTMTIAAHTIEPL